MTLAEALAALEKLGDARLQALNAKRGISGVQFGVKMGDIRTLAKKLKSNHDLGLALWETAIFEARMLAILLLDPQKLSPDQLEYLVSSNTLAQVADWLMGNIVKAHPEKEALRIKWMTDPAPMRARAGWSLTAEKIMKDAESLDLTAILDRVELEMAGADPAAQWTMNMALANIGIYHPALRNRAMMIGETLGVYRDYPTPKGCTSPFAPIWIAAIAARQT